MPRQEILPEAFLGWHQIQDSLSKLSGLEIALYSPDGKPIGMVSGESPFCRQIRRTGIDGATCEHLCGEFIRGAAESTSIKSFKCPSGQNVFAIPLGEPCTIIISGGKYFLTKKEHEKAIAYLTPTETKLRPTGRHRYRFIGKKRLSEAVSLVQNTASQFFETHRQKYSYQIRHNRQTALLENSSFMLHDTELPEIARKMLGCAMNLFESEGAAVIMRDVSTGSLRNIYISNGNDDLLSRASTSIESAFNGSSTSGKQLRIDENGMLMLPGVDDDIRQVVAVQFAGTGTLSGVIALVNPAPIDDIRALRVYVNHSAAILENAALKNTISQKVSHLTSMSAIGRGMGSLADADEIFAFVFDKSTQLLRSERSSLMVIDQETDELIIKLQKGMDEETAGSLRIRPGEGIAGGVVATGAPIMVEDISADSGLNISGRPGYRTNSFISMPITVRNKVIGVLNLADKENGGSFNAEDLELMNSFAAQATIALERALFYERIGELEEVSIKDTETGLLNRRYFNERLIDELDRSRRYKHEFSVIIARLEGGSRSVADRADPGLVHIRQAAEAMRPGVRSNDVLSHYGEDVFALILPETAADRAGIVVDRLIQNVSDKMPAHRLVIGLSGYPEDGGDMKSLLESAYGRMTDE